MLQDRFRTNKINLQNCEHWGLEMFKSFLQSIIYPLSWIHHLHPLFWSYFISGMVFPLFVFCPDRTSSGASAMLSGLTGQLQLTLFMRWPKRLHASMWLWISTDIHTLGAQQWGFGSLQQGSFLRLSLKSNLRWQILMASMGCCNCVSWLCG